ncbi:proprotein convertase P-domain-containing protein, partial [Halomarinibacterium sedimenti]
MKKTTFLFFVLLVTSFFWQVNAQKDRYATARGIDASSYQDPGQNRALNAVIYNTTHLSTTGAEITTTTGGPNHSMGDAILLAGTERQLTSITVDLFNLASAAPYNLTVRVYTACPTSGATGPCGSGPGILVPGSTFTQAITPGTLGFLYQRTLTFPAPVNVSTEVDNTITVMLTASRNDVFWVLGETPVVGAMPVGETGNGFVTRCGSATSNNGCTRNFGLPNNFAMTIRASGPPPNDLCANAIVVDNGTYNGYTTFGSIDAPGAFCGTAAQTAPDVWYMFDDISNSGMNVTATTCSPNTNYDTKISVYRGVCGALVCVGGNDDDFSCPSGGLQSTVNFTTDGSSNYYIMVHGFSTSNGVFDLNISGIIIGSAPLIACPSDITINNDPGQCGAVMNFSGTAIDAEDGDISANIIATPPSGSFFPVGTTTVTMEVTDSDGNTVSCDFDITVVDNEAPVVACQDVTVALDANGDYNLTIAEVLLSANDNCGVASIAFEDPNAADVTECGPNGLPIPATGTGPGAMNPSPAVVTTVGTVGVDYAIDRVDLDLTHTFDADLDITLTSPNGLVLDLSSDNGGAGDNYTNTVFMDGFPSITTGTAPFTGTFQPEGGPMNAFFAGEPVNGNWTLNIFDDAGGDSGVLNNYCITFASLAPATVPSIDLTCANVGANTFTVVVTDVNGNTSTCETEVTVQDIIAPVLQCIGEPAPVTDSASASPGLPFGAAPTVVTSTIDVTDDFIITDLNVDVNISHTWVGDVIVTLESPSGTMVTIIDRPGDITAPPDGCAGDNIVATLDDEAATPVEDECAAGTPTINGSFIPNNPLSAFDGESTLGTWTMTVEDAFPAFDDGVFNSWAIHYTHNVTAAPYDAILDGTTGTVTVNASDLLLSVDEACGYTVSFGAGGSPINECGDGLPAAIDENLPPTESTATVAESGVLGTDYAIDTVTLDITHTFDGDLDIELISPAGTVLMLSDQNG